MPTRDKIILRCRYSIAFKDLFAFKLVNAIRLGSIVGCSRDMSVVYVLWDGRITVDSLSIDFVDIVEEVIESKDVNLAMKLMASDKLKLLQEEAKKRHAASVIPVVKSEEPEPPQPKAIKLKSISPIRVEKIKKVKEPKPEEIKDPVVKKKSMLEQPQKPSVGMNKVKAFAGRAIYDPKTRMSDNPRVPIPEKDNKPFVRPPALYSNSKSLYGIDYNDV